MKIELDNMDVFIAIRRYIDEFPNLDIVDIDEITLKINGGDVDFFSLNGMSVEIDDLS